MKTTARIVLCTVFLLASAPLFADSGPSANGDFQFTSGGNPLSIQFDARRQNNGSTTGQITFTGTVELSDQDVDGEGLGPTSGLVNVSLTVDVDCLNIKLKTHYARKRKLYEESYPDFYDNDLKQLFAAEPEAAGRMKASAYLRQRRRQLMDSVCQWTNEKKFSINKLLARLIDRCDELALHIKADEAQQNFQVSAYVTTLVMNYLFTGKFKRTK